MLISEVAVRKAAFVSDPHGSQRPEMQRDWKKKANFQSREHGGWSPGQRIRVVPGPSTDMARTRSCLITVFSETRSTTPHPQVEQQDSRSRELLLYSSFWFKSSASTPMPGFDASFWCGPCLPQPALCRSPLLLPWICIWELFCQPSGPQWADEEQSSWVVEEPASLLYLSLKSHKNDKLSSFYD